MAEIVAPQRLTAFEYRGRLKGGRSRPMLVACRDEDGNEHKVVLKLRNVEARDCTFGPASLACELVCSILARMAGLSVPDYAIVIVDDREGFVRSVPESESRTALLNNLGENFGSTYLEDHAKYVASLAVGNVGNLRLESVMAFDSYVLNNDRKTANPNLIVRGDSVVLIDHSLSFPHLNSPSVAEPWTNWLPDVNVQDHCTYDSLRGTMPKFEAFVNFVNDELNDDDCREILNVVPESWQRGASQDKDTILRYLLRRGAPFLGEGVKHLTRVCGL